MDVGAESLKIHINLAWQRAHFWPFTLAKHPLICLERTPHTLHIVRECMNLRLESNCASFDVNRYTKNLIINHPEKLGLSMSMNLNYSRNKINNFIISLQWKRDARRKRKTRRSVSPSWVWSNRSYSLNKWWLNRHFWTLRVWMNINNHQGRETQISRTTAELTISKIFPHLPWKKKKKTNFNYLIIWVKSFFSITH